MENMIIVLAGLIGVLSILVFFGALAEKLGWE